MTRIIGRRDGPARPGHATPTLDARHARRGFGAGRNKADACGAYTGRMDTYDQPRSMGSPIDLCATIDAAVTAAHAGAAILQSYAHHRADLVIDRKARNDLVSQADREAEAAIIQELRARTPHSASWPRKPADKLKAAPPGTSTRWMAPPISCMTSPLRGFHRIDRARRHIGVCRPAAERGHAGGWRGLRPLPRRTVHRRLRPGRVAQRSAHLVLAHADAG